MPSTVLFTDFSESAGRSILDKLSDLAGRLPLSAAVAAGELVAVKVHFGESGNTAFVAPHFVRAVADKVKEQKAKPFVTDANTLYVGSRSNSVDHLETAARHGFTGSSLGCPVVIADGLRGGSSVEAGVDGTHFRTVKLAHELARADAIVCVTHFKGHELAGFGGAIKNLGMGGGARAAKLAMHSDVAPQIRADACTACGKCSANCPSGAITVGGRAVIDPATCIGCGSCIVVCPVRAVRNGWDSGPRLMQEKMAEHLAGFARLKPGKIAYFNFINNVSPACDCYGHTGVPVVPDVGICASLDPVAADAASCDLVNRAAGRDVFRELYPEADWSIQLDHAQRLGLGSRKYTLVTID